MSEGTDVRELALQWSGYRLPGYGDISTQSTAVHAGVLARALLAAEKRAEEAEGEVKRLRKISEDAHDGEWVDLADTIIALNERVEEAEWALERAEPVVALAAEEHLLAARPTLVVVRGAIARLKANR